MSDNWNGRRTKIGDPLTVRQQHVLDIIRRHQAKYGVPPTIRELGRIIGIANTHGVVCHLRALAAKGRIRKALEGGARLYLPVVPDGCCPSCGQRLGTSNAKGDES